MTMIYKFSIVGKWHLNRFCTGMEVIKSAEVFPIQIVIMEENGSLCRKCKG